MRLQVLIAQSIISSQGKKLFQKLITKKNCFCDRKKTVFLDSTTTGEFHSRSLPTEQDLRLQQAILQSFDCFVLNSSAVIINSLWFHNH